MKRAGGLTTFVGHVFTLTIKKSGSFKASTPNLSSLGEADGKIVAAGPKRIRFAECAAGSGVFDWGCGGGGVYAWRVAGRQLTFTKVKDQIADRTKVFWGVWKRK